jgi:hypothetical protein
MGRSTEGRRVERHPQVREVHGQAEDRDRVGLVPRRPFDRRAAERFASGQDGSLQAEQRRRITQLERALGRKTYELEIAGEALRGWE